MLDVAREAIFRLMIHWFQSIVLTGFVLPSLSGRRAPGHGRRFGGAQGPWSIAAS